MRKASAKVYCKIQLKELMFENCQNLLVQTIERFFEKWKKLYEMFNSFIKINDYSNFHMKNWTFKNFW